MGLRYDATNAVWREVVRWTDATYRSALVAHVDITATTDLPLIDNFSAGVLNAPVNTSAPVASGTPVNGATIRTTNGTWDTVQGETPNRSETGDQKPFGSIFWSNGGRSNWNIQRLNESSVGSIVTVSLYHRKSNTGRLRSPLAFEIDFGPQGTTIRRVNAIEVPEIAAKMSLAERISGAIRRGPRPIADIAAELGADVESVRTAAKRHDGKRFKYYDDANGNKVVALLDWKHKP